MPTETAYGMAVVSNGTSALIAAKTYLNSHNYNNGNDSGYESEASGESQPLDNGGVNGKFDESGKFQKMGKQKGSNAEKMPNDVANELEIKNKKEFFKFLHKVKKADKRGGADNYTWDELIEIGKDFIELNKK